MNDDQQLKLVDFGFAIQGDINVLQGHFGTRPYMAPEIREQKKYDGTEVDIFSTGVVLFILAFGHFPF